MKLLVLLLISAATLTGENWPLFRGAGNSLTSAENLPLTWSVEENIRWEADLSGYGQSSPVIWGDLVVVTFTEGEEKETLVVEGFDLKTGDSRWVYKQPSSAPAPVSNYISRSAPTPAIDANQVYAFFESGDTLSLNHQGELLWQRELQTEYGEFKGNHGLGSSPTLIDDALVVLVDHSGPSYLVAMNKTDGQNKWKVDRPERVSWSSPVVTGEGSEQQVILSSNGVLQRYSATNGELLWETEGLDGNTVPSATIAENYVLVGSNKRGQNQLFQIKPDSNELEPVWQSKDQISAFGSPLIYGEYVYFVNKSGVASCLSLATGEEVWKERLPSSCWASAVGTGDRIYFFSNDGTTTVIENGAEFKKLSENSLPTEDKVYGVALVDNAIVIRTGEKLTCIGKP
ncbi:outer membrane biogenesis protein BamB [Polystyrenella longa]|uniref:Outer membrane biogenesis protein BamB n=1 Tax=Polystyrenella longa TaxID=2528007 RepID=A0A518CT39_9PLAN|nr:PQQ-binding-like beta-propeller repeat protein [Polystyrenella longa]QDU82397.1 outer membrane biogenesis protein BamB [Polystyrenella longa]